MPESRTPVLTIEVSMLCPVCQKGHMHPTGITLTVNPPLFPHVCAVCDFSNNFNRTYPYFEYEPIPKQS